MEALASSRRMIMPAIAAAQTLFRNARRLRAGATSCIASIAVLLSACFPEFQLAHFFDTDAIVASASAAGLPQVRGLFRALSGTSPMGNRSTSMES